MYRLPIMLHPGAPGSILSRGEGRSPLCILGTPRGPAALALEHDELLDRDTIFLEDVYFPDADECSRRAAMFLRDNLHDALPQYVDDWTARDRTIHQYSGKSGWDAPIRHILTRRTIGIDGHRYLQQHRMRGAGLPPAVALRIVERLADACRLAHAAGVVHGGILLETAVRVRPNGRPVLESWGHGRRCVGNIGCDHERLWWGVEDVLGAKPPSGLPVGDVFALGSMLSLLITGAPAYERGKKRFEYRAPSSQGETFAWLDDVVGLACDPSRGFSLNACTLQAKLASLLVERRPPIDRVRADLARANMTSVAEFFASADDSIAGELTEDVCQSISRDVLGALQNERPMPLFAELAVAVCPEARLLVREFALDRTRASWGRLMACRLLAFIDDERALDIAIAANTEEPGLLPSVGWSTRAQFVTTTGMICRHPWSGLRGEPRFDERGALRRDCPACGDTVEMARSFIEERTRRAFTQASTPASTSASTPLTQWPPIMKLTLDSAQKPAVCELLPGLPKSIGSEPNDTLYIEGLDPAEHAKLMAVDAFRISFILGVTIFEDGSELRTAVLDTRRTSEQPLRIGSLQFTATAPGMAMVRVDPGVTATLREDKAWPEGL